MANHDVRADVSIAKHLETAWEDAQDRWSDDQSKAFGDKCMGTLIGKVRELGDEGRKVAEEMESREAEIRKIIESC